MTDNNNIPVLRNLGICAISRLRCTFSESQDCVTCVRNLKIARQRVIYCVARRIEDILDKWRLPP